MGTAEKWQDRVLKDLSKELVVIFNPRRDDWDKSWVQEADNPQFFEQVTWELDSLAESDIKIFYFDPKTQSPITLLELGLFVNQCLADDMSGQRVIVCCPKGYWRKGNVDIVCQRAGVSVFETYDEMIAEVKTAIRFIQNLYP